MIRHPLDTTLLLLIGFAIATIGASWNPFAVPFVDVAVLGLAALKGRCILLDFLGLRSAPAIWRGLVSAWVFGVVSFACAASAVRLLI